MRQLALIIAIAFSLVVRIFDGQNFTRWVFCGGCVRGSTLSLFRKLK
jgi:hypothetical protein